jgi:hypothetical protein
MTDEKNEAEPSGASGGSLANRRRAMSKYDEWLAAKGIARGRGTAMDEILWLREERNRLRLTEAEREALEWASKKMRLLGDAYDPERAATLRGLLERFK